MRRVFGRGAVLLVLVAVFCGGFIAGVLSHRGDPVVDVEVSNSARRSIKTVRLGGYPDMAQDRTIPFSSEDPEMEAAIGRAKESFGQFLRAFLRPAKGQRSFLVKAVFVEGEQVEHIWLADLDFSGKKPRGVVANEPALSGMKFMQSVDFEPAQITDWMYIEDGYLVGGYTTRVIRERMRPEERTALDARTPYKVRELI